MKSLYIAPSIYIDISAATLSTIRLCDAVLNESLDLTDCKVYGLIMPIFNNEKKTVAIMRHKTWKPRLEWKQTKWYSKHGSLQIR